MSSRNLIITTDAGTSSIRACLYDSRGFCLRQRNRNIPIPMSGNHSEADPATIWSAIVAVIAELEAPAEQVVAIGVTAALGMVVLDGSDKPLGPVIMWQDRRATAEAKEIAQAINTETLRLISGRRVDAELTAPKLIWLKRHRGGLFSRIASVLSLKDWLLFQLCHARVTDPTSASYSLLFDVLAGSWNLDLLAALGISETWMPPVCDATQLAGSLGEDAARACGLTAGTPVAVGGPDGTMGCVGAGMVQSGMAVDVIGTTDVVFAHSIEPVRDMQRSLVLNRFPAGQAFAVGGPMAATGGAASWLATNLGFDLTTATAEASAIPAGSEGLVFHPVLAGSRTPRWDSSERGMIAGLGFEHSRGHLFRALLEGCAAEVADVFDALNALGVPVGEIRAVGGGVGNNLWMRIRASMLERSLFVPDVSEASSLGTAMVAAVALDIYSDLDAAAAAMVRIRDRIDPDPEWVDVYRAMRVRRSELREAIARLPQKL